jgi:general stress protein 26
MTRDQLLGFLREHALAVQASVALSGYPQSAVVAVAVSDSLELVFDTVETSRKAANLRRDPKISFVVGGWSAGDERTAQYEGIASEPDGAAWEATRDLYLARYPEGRARLSWPGLIYFRVRPVWIRYSDFNQQPPDIAVFDFS